MIFVKKKVEIVPFPGSFALNFWSVYSYRLKQLRMLERVVSGVLWWLCTVLQLMWLLCNKYGTGPTYCLGMLNGCKFGRFSVEKKLSNSVLQALQICRKNMYFLASCNQFLND